MLPLLKDRESLKFLFYLARTSADGNCLHNACPLAIVGDESLAMCLRCLTSIELFMNSEYYASHNVLSEWKGTEVLIHMILSFACSLCSEQDVMVPFLITALSNSKYTTPRPHPDHAQSWKLLA